MNFISYMSLTPPQRTYYTLRQRAAGCQLTGEAMDLAATITLSDMLNMPSSRMSVTLTALQRSLDAAPPPSAAQQTTQEGADRANVIGLSSPDESLWREAG